MKLWFAGDGEEGSPVRVEAMLTKFLREHQRDGLQFLFDCVTGRKANEFEGMGWYVHWRLWSGTLQKSHRIVCGVFAHHGCMNAICKPSTLQSAQPAYELQGQRPGAQGHIAGVKTALQYQSAVHALACSMCESAA